MGYSNFALPTPSEPSAITVWKPTMTYIADVSYVTHAKSIWLCKVSGTGLQPTLLNNNWRQVANVDSAQYNVFTGAPISTPTYNFPVTQTSALFNTTASNITVTMPSVASLSSPDTSNRMQWFRLVKVSKGNSLIITLPRDNKFFDGTTSVTYTEPNVYKLYCLFGTTTWIKD